MAIRVNTSGNIAEENPAFHPVPGKIMQRQEFTDRSRADNFNNMTSNLHYGFILGLHPKVLMFFGCLIAALLPFTGFTSGGAETATKG